MSASSSSSSTCSSQRSLQNVQEWSALENQLRLIWNCFTQDVPPDSHCFYHVLAHYLQGYDLASPSTVDDLRMKIADFLPTTLERLSKEVSQQLVEERGGIDSAQAGIRTNAWAGPLEMQIAADRFEVTILLFTMRDDGFLGLQEILPPLKNSNKSILMAYCDHHYRIVRPSCASSFAIDSIESPLTNHDVRKSLLSFFRYNSKSIAGELISPDDPTPDYIRKQVFEKLEDISRDANFFVEKNGYLFTGPSGAGKSSLLNDLLKDDIFNIGNQPEADTQFPIEINVDRSLPLQHYAFEVVYFAEWRTLWQPIRRQLVSIINDPNQGQEEHDLAMKWLSSAYPTLTLNRDTMARMIKRNWKDPIELIPDPTNTFPSALDMANHLDTLKKKLSENIHLHCAIDKIKISAHFPDSPLPDGKYFDVPGDEGAPENQHSVYASQLRRRKQGRLQIMSQARHAFIVCKYGRIENFTESSVIFNTFREISAYPHLLNSSTLILRAYLPDQQLSNLRRSRHPITPAVIDSLKEPNVPPLRLLKQLAETKCLDVFQTIESLHTSGRTYFSDLCFPEVAKHLNASPDEQIQRIAQTCRSPLAEEIDAIHDMSDDLSTLCHLCMVFPTFKTDSLANPLPRVDDQPIVALNSLPNPYAPDMMLFAKAEREVTKHAHHTSVRALARKAGVHSGASGCTDFVQDISTYLDLQAIVEDALTKDSAFLYSALQAVADRFNLSLKPTQVLFKFNPPSRTRLLLDQWDVDPTETGLDDLITLELEKIFRRTSRSFDPYHQRNDFINMLQHELERVWPQLVHTLQNRLTKFIVESRKYLQKKADLELDSLLRQAILSYPTTNVVPGTHRLLARLLSFLNKVSHLWSRAKKTAGQNLALQGMTDNDLMNVFCEPRYELEELSLTGNLFTEESLKWLSDRNRFPNLQQIFLQFNSIKSIPLGIPFTVTLTPQRPVSGVPLASNWLAPSFVGKRIAVVFETCEYPLPHRLPRINGESIVSCLAYLKFNIFHVSKQRSLELWDIRKWNSMLDWVQIELSRATTQIFFVFYWAGHSISVQGTRLLLQTSYRNQDLVHLSDLYQILNTKPTLCHSLFLIDGCMGSEIPTQAHFSTEKQREDPLNALFLTARLMKCLPPAGPSPTVPTSFTQSILSAFWRMILEGKSIHEVMSESIGTSQAMMTVEGTFGNVSLSLPDYLWENLPRPPPPTAPPTPDHN